MNEYHYGVGRIRSLEARLISPAQAARLAAAADFEEAFGVLSETPYSDNLPRLKEPFDFEELCAMELAALKELMERLAPDNEIIKAIFKKYDYLALKKDLREAYRQGKEPAVANPDDKDLSEALADAVKAYEQAKDPQALDLALDKHYYTHLRQVCAGSPSPLIREWVDHVSDLTNLKTLLRLQALKPDKQFLGSALLPAGLIDPDTLLDLRDKSPQDVIARLSFTPYFPYLTEGIEHFIKDGSFSLLEKAMDDFILSRFKQAKYLSSGLEPLVGYILAKENEIKTLRFVLVSKKNYLKPERIRERLRLSYV